MRGWLLTALFGLLVSWGLYTVLTDEPELAAVMERSEKPASLVNIEIKEYQKDQIKLKLLAKEAWVYERSEVTDFVGVNGVIAPENVGGKGTQFWSDQGKGEDKIKRLTLEGSVRVIFPQGRTLYTERLYFDQEKDLLWGDKPVRVVGHAEDVKASGMKYQLKKDRLTLTKPNIEVSL